MISPESGKAEDTALKIDKLIKYHPAAQHEQIDNLNMFA